MMGDAVIADAFTQERTLGRRLVHAELLALTLRSGESGGEILPGDPASPQVPASRDRPLLVVLVDFTCTHFRYWPSRRHANGRCAFADTRD